MTFPDDQQALLRREGAAGAERVVSSFYDSFPYERRPELLDYADDPSFESTMRGQEVGVWSGLLPSNPAIWVVGCGAIQAVVTALRFPTARVVGSDIAGQSLAAARDTAAELGIGNLTLRQESVLDAGYQCDFDLVFCTGVLHHTADPAEGLRRLATALRPSGLLELMVYNRFHRLGTSAVQEAVRLLRPPERSQADFADDLHVAQQLLEAVPADGWTAQFLEGWRSDDNNADALINPLERSYTVASLAALLEESSAGLRLAAPVQNWLDVGRGTDAWDLTFADPAVADRYEALDDQQRWHLLNLLRFERSPLLWFSVQRLDAPDPIPAQREICDSFLSAAFRPASTRHQALVLGDDGRYERRDAWSLPVAPPPVPLDRLVAACDGRRPMAKVFAEASVARDYATVNNARLRLTTRLHPYLVSCG